MKRVQLDLHMKAPDNSKHFIFTLLVVLLFFTAADAQDLEVNGLFSVDKVSQGRVIKAAIVATIPKGLYVNANKPFTKNIVNANIKLEAERGIRIGPAVFPRATARTFKFSAAQLFVYEGRIIIRFNVSVPPNVPVGMTTIRARLVYQACADQGCNSARTREISMPISVVAPNETVKRINKQIFGGN